MEQKQTTKGIIYKYCFHSHQYNNNNKYIIVVYLTFDINKDRKTTKRIISELFHVDRIETRMTEKTYIVSVYLISKEQRSQHNNNVHFVVIFQFQQNTLRNNNMIYQCFLFLHKMFEQEQRILFKYISLSTDKKEREQQ